MRLLPRIRYGERVPLGLCLSEHRGLVLRIPLFVQRGVRYREEYGDYARGWWCYSALLGMRKHASEVTFQWAAFWAPLGSVQCTPDVFREDASA